MKSKSSSAVLAALIFGCAFASACGTTSPSAPPPSNAPVLLPGEVCDADNRPDLSLSFDATTYAPFADALDAQVKGAPTVVVGPGQSRSVRFTVEPDLCVPATVTMASSNAGVAAAPAPTTLDLRHPTYDFLVTGLVRGSAVITATMSGARADGTTYSASAALTVEVRDPAPPTCSGDAADGMLSGAAPQMNGTGALATAYVSAPAGAFSRTDEFALPSFPVSVVCGGDLTAAFPGAALTKLGPAVSFSMRAPMTMSKATRRELEVAIPVNPAAFPPNARMRHLRVLYTGPRVKTPRVVPVSSPRIERDGADYVLKFQTPWLGTFQAAVEPDAGTKLRRRHLTHRAVIGISMGGGGAATFGLRHHDRFDVLRPIGGPTDYTWLLWYIERYALGGFCPAGQTCPTIAPNLYPLDEPYAHTLDFDHWFYQTGSGNGGSFDRSEYIHLMEDLSLVFGNANGQNADPALPFLVAGPHATDPWVAGDPSFGAPPGIGCAFTVDPIKDDPNEAAQQSIQSACSAFRCDPKNAWRAETGYFDDEYNPDGSLPVATTCDGAQMGTSPYVDTWAPGGTTPANLFVYVDLNRNGTRDMGEPILRSGHEPYDDCGVDATCDASEPGYDRESNPDPAGDDYDYMLNPTGTEGNHRYDEGEAFRDYGLDGVAGTAGSNVAGDPGEGEAFRDYGLDGVAGTAGSNVAGDPGEGDGKYTEAKGLTNAYASDPHGMISGRVTGIPAGPIDDDALRRLDVLVDGGVRDLFNLGVVGSHLTGQIAGRLGADGLPIRSVAFYNGFHTLPGEPSLTPDGFNPAFLRWPDIADVPDIRYGDLEATPQELSNGDGQHVGTVNQLLFRLETSFFYVGRRWPDADRLETEESRENPAPGAAECEVIGHCEHTFTGPGTKRTGPIAVSLPPGYALAENVQRNVRYPVLYVLHGYGQEPADLEAVAIFTNNFMNVAERSSATRLGKFILVYVDGRCRDDASGAPECIRGSFYMNSTRPGGAEIDDWFDEVVDFIDHQYRPMGPSDVDVVE